MSKVATETIEHLEKARALINKLSPSEIGSQIKSLVEAHNSWRLQCINLNAAESAMSPLAEWCLTSDLARRGTVGQIGVKAHKGARYEDQIEALLVELAKKLFRVEYVECRPVTTSVADGLVMRCLTEVGDTILALEAPRGHATWREIGYAGMRGVKVVDIPFNYEEWNVDLEGLARVSRENRARLMIVGTSGFLFPHPLREMRKIADEINARIWYDGAHVLGLIAGGEFQDPIREGADLLNGTASKTLSGPMGGLILHNDKELDQRLSKTFSGHLSAIGLERLPALVITLAEWLEFGRDYARQILNNAKAFAKALDETGFDVVAKNRGYTKSHTVLVNVKDLAGGNIVATTLERANIITSAFKLWRPDEAYEGLRLGVTEMTRYGMKEAEMERIAEFMGRAVLAKENLDTLRSEVVKFRKQFTEIHFCFRS